MNRAHCDIRHRPQFRDALIPHDCWLGAVGRAALAKPSGSPAMRQGDYGQHGEIAFTLPVVVEQQVEVETGGERAKANEQDLRHR